ncbi:MAG: hypothetical protein K0R09_3339 [Clostridiales bacterium]|jgi:2'-hydroxyisoflavone reductase|nr:hypothetical protein [Clostridiales bacterium]
MNIDTYIMEGKYLKLLIIGGTGFLGHCLVDAALRHGHSVTVFNRGRNNNVVGPDVEKLLGDRKSNLEALKGRQWDVAIDTCGMAPWDVKMSGSMLANSVEHYTFISSISVYSKLDKPLMDENTEVCTLSEEEMDEMKSDTTGQALYKYYGAAKYLCEQEAERAMPGRVLNVRPGLLVGAYDKSDRFTYWVRRIAMGGEVMCPGNPDAPVQFIDTRDIAEWIIRACEKRVVGVFNATGPKEALTMGSLLEKIRETSKINSALKWVSEEFLLNNNVQYWSDMPLWIPDGINSPGFLSADINKALNEGLEFRPLSQTIQSILDWDETRDKSIKLNAGITLDRERELLNLWSNS